MSREIRYRIRVPEWIIPHWWKVAYKIPPEVSREFGELLQIRPDERFNKVVSGYVRAVIEKGEMPPEDIAPAILNLANDFMDGREMIIRTGDYIAIQNHLRKAK